MRHNQAIGKMGEDSAVKFLEKKGYSILFKNWRCEYGELDIVGLKNEQLVFFEVKTRTGIRYGWPEESVTLLKQEHLLNCANTFFDHYPQYEKYSWQIDVIAIMVNSRDADKLQITQFENAVTDR